MTERASRIALNRLLQHLARLLVGLVATPLIVGGLGPMRYGAWLVLQQSVSYLGALDFQSMGTLRYRLGLSQHSDDFDVKRRLVGAALVLWALMLIPLAAAAAVVVYFAPWIVALPAEFHFDVRWAFAISAFSIAFSRLASLPANVLRGVNREYGAEIASMLAVLISGAISVAAVQWGFGLAGLSAAGILGIALVSAVQARVMLRVCPWMGVQYPSKEEILRFAKLSGALLASGLSLFLLLSVEMIVAAHVVSLEAAAILGTTGAALRFSVEPIQQLLSSSSAGVVGLCGRGEWRRVSAVRAELQLQSMVVVGWMGACILLLNESFLDLWLGPGFFGGNQVTALLVVLSLFTVLLRNDGILLDAMGLISPKTIVTVFGCVVSIACAVLAGSSWGLPGIVLGLCLGRALVYGGQRLCLEWRLRELGVERQAAHPHLWITVVSLLALAGYGARFVHASTWIEFLIHVAVAGGLCGLCIVVVGLRANERAQLIARIRHVLFVLKGKLFVREGTS